MAEKDSAEKDNEQTFGVRGEYVTLGQLLKFAGAVDTGGEVKSYLAEVAVIVNGVPEQRRGRKLRPGDIVQIPDGPTLHLIPGEADDLEDNLEDGTQEVDLP